MSLVLVGEIQKDGSAQTLTEQGHQFQAVVIEKGASSKIEGVINSTTVSGEPAGKQIILAGPTAPLPHERVVALQRIQFNSEPLDLACEWMECRFRTTVMEDLLNHVVGHVPAVSVDMQDVSDFQVFLCCRWQSCPWKTAKKSEDLQRHLYLHAYHTKLKCIGTNTRNRTTATLECKANPESRNILPDLAENLVCAWDKCSERFINIQTYYDHIKRHCEDNPKGKFVEGGVRCCWAGCNNSFVNITKLKEHMRSHTQEKVLACPNCGGLFSSRTRFFDHCKRQIMEDDALRYVCEVCMKAFSTARLLRDHIRSHINTFRCQDCDMSCSSQSSLNAHILYRHSNQRTYPCQQCSHSSKTYSDLVRHVKTHSKPVYSCEEIDCDFEARSITSLARHYEKEHRMLDPSRYLCHVCEKKYTRGNELTKHLVKEHHVILPSGHPRFRYKIHNDGYFRLCTLRYESLDVGAVRSEGTVHLQQMKVESVLPH